MKAFYVMNKTSEKEAEISLIGEIGADYWGDGSRKSAADFKKDLDNLGPVETINLSINSPGGSFFDGLAIYNMLKNHKATVNTTVLGLAASAASTVAMAGDNVSMSEDAFIMIHNAHSMSWGDHREFTKTAAELLQFDATIANIYAKKTKKDEKDLRDMMDAETWMNGTAAKEAGFVDEVTNAKKVAACFNFDKFRNTPKSLMSTNNVLELYSNQIDLIKRRHAR